MYLEYANVHNCLHAFCPGLPPFPRLLSEGLHLYPEAFVKRFRKTSLASFKASRVVAWRIFNTFNCKRWELGERECEREIIDNLANPKIDLLKHGQG